MRELDERERECVREWRAWAAPPYLILETITTAHGLIYPIILSCTFLIGLAQHTQLFMDSLHWSLTKS